MGGSKRQVQGKKGQKREVDSTGELAARVLESVMKVERQRAAGTGFGSEFISMCCPQNCECMLPSIPPRKTSVM
eukprot:2649277-Rhodomonas_salina.2